METLSDMPRTAEIIATIAINKRYETLFKNPNLKMGGDGSQQMKWVKKG